VTEKMCPNEECGAMEHPGLSCGELFEKRRRSVFMTHALIHSWSSDLNFGPEFGAACDSFSDEHMHMYMKEAKAQGMPPHAAVAAYGGFMLQIGYEAAFRTGLCRFSVEENTEGELDLEAEELPTDEHVRGHFPREDESLDKAKEGVLAALKDAGIEVDPENIHFLSMDNAKMAALSDDLRRRQDENGEKPPGMYL
jgi:hypothetical protein